MIVTRKTKFQYRIQHILFILLLLACIGFSGWLSNEYNQRSDWTAGNRHSLSKDTLQLLKQLPFDVNLRSYQPDDPALNKAVNEILTRYKTNKDNFSFQLINPDIFVEQAKTDNIQRYGQTIIEYNGNTERIEALSEEAITNALIRLQRETKPEIVFLSQHGERSISDDSPVGYSQLARKLLTKGFDVKKINLLQQSLPSKNAILVLGSINKPLLDNEQKKIQQFIENGGNILWLQDPAIDNSQLIFSNLLNVNFIAGVVVDDNQEVNRMLQLSHAAFIPILEYKVHPITGKNAVFHIIHHCSSYHCWQ